MASSRAEETVSPTWTFCFFNCVAPNIEAGERKEHRKSAMRIGVERDMAVMYQQPHLVPPMKLTVYDPIPATPTLPPPSHLSKMVTQGRTLACRASSHASFSMRKRASSRPIISNPQAVVTRLPSTRRYRPLELSIYAPRNRLSDLPDFDSKALNFADDGAIQLPPRAIVRAKSQDFKRTPSQRTPSKSKSMIEPTLLHRRMNTASTVVSTSRPPSSFDALRSHPVSWIEGSLPDLPAQPQCHHHNRTTTQAASILTPMQEEFTPACTPACITIDGTLLGFPREDPIVRPTSPTPQIVSTNIPHSQTITLPKHFVLASPPPPLSQDSPTLPQSLYHGSPNLSISSSRSSTSTRLSSWLSHSHTRGLSSSTSISTNTTRSFAEHRRKRSEFYSLKMPAMPTPPVSAPTSTRIPFQQNFKVRSRQRTMSTSSVGSNSTVNTDIMSLEDEDGRGSVTTMSTGRGGGRRDKKEGVRVVEKEVEVDMLLILQGPGILEKEVGIAI